MYSFSNTTSLKNPGKRASNKNPGTGMTTFFCGLFDFFQKKGRVDWTLNFQIHRSLRPPKRHRPQILQDQNFAGRFLERCWLSGTRTAENAFSGQFPASLFYGAPRESFPAKIAAHRKLLQKNSSPKISRKKRKTSGSHYPGFVERVRFRWAIHTRSVPTCGPTTSWGRPPGASSPGVKCLSWGPPKS